MSRDAKVPRELPITGYVDRLSKRPGERLQVHVSVPGGGEFRARLVRVISADPNPRGAGINYEDLSRHLDQLHSGQHFQVRAGSYLEARSPGLGRSGAQSGSCTWTALVWTRHSPETPQTVIAHESEDGLIALSLIGADVQAEVASKSGMARCRLEGALRPFGWNRVWVSCDPASNKLLVGCHPLSAAGRDAATREVTESDLHLPGQGRILVGARDAASPREHFNGKIEDPAVIEGWRDSWMDPAIRLQELGRSLVAGWDFSLDIPTQTARDVGPSGCDGVLRNTPTRAVCGARWSGQEMHWIHSPHEYAAIHFHSDDLGDCGWPAAFEFTIPTALDSGAYAIHLSSNDGEDWVPFYVLPAPSRPRRARVVFLAPTFTYQAYANAAFGIYDEAMRARVAAWRAYPFYPDDYSAYGVSTYNRHPDGSGVAYSSRLRPMIFMRPASLTFNDKNGSGLHHYAADTHLLAWLESRGIDFDVVTDEDLDEEGLSLLAPYAAVLTGTHPEYHTERMLDALQEYTRDGGRLAYLGGNGFYWKIGRNRSLPWLIEVRRGEGGTRAWAAEPGEYYHACDGSYGGLWRRNGRNPQALVGVGFSCQAEYEATPFHRTKESYDDAVAWIFDGVQGEVIGDYGLSAGGAAGYELDRSDRSSAHPSTRL